MHKPDRLLKRCFNLLIAVIPVICFFIYLNNVVAGSSADANQNVIYFDMALDKARQRIYGSDEAGGQIHVIDANTLGVVMTIPVGTMDGPNGIDISPDGQELAVALPDPPQVVFLNLDTLTVTAVITTNPGSHLPYDVIYGRPGRLYSAGRNGSHIQVYDTVSKTIVGQSTSNNATNPHMAMTADKNTLFVSRVNGTPQRLYRYDITTDSPIETAQTSNASVDALAVNPDGSKVYTPRGQMWNGDLNNLLNYYPIFQNEIEYIPATNRIYISNNDEIAEFDGDTMLPLKNYPVPTSNTGVARANTAGDLLYVSTDLGILTVTLDMAEQPPTAVSLDGPTEGLMATTYTFTATVAPTDTFTPLIYTWQASEQETVYHSNTLSDTASFIWTTLGQKTITVTARNVTGQVVNATHTISMTGAPIPDPVQYFDMVVDNTRQRIYGTDAAGDLIHVIDMTTLDVITSIPVSVGDSPRGIDISPGETELAVALHGSSEVAFIDIDTLTITDRVVPDADTIQNRPYDVLYGRPGRLYSVGNANALDYVHTFDTVTKLEIAHSAEELRSQPRLAITADQNTIYVSRKAGSFGHILRFDVTTDTPVQTASTVVMPGSFGPFGPLAVNPADNRSYSSQGEVYNPGLDTRVGTFTPKATEIELSVVQGKFYTNDDNHVNEYDIEDYSFVRYYQLPDLAGVARLNGAEDTLYISTNSGIISKTLGQPFNPVEQVTISGPASGDVDLTHILTATASPMTVTQPLTYVWQIEEAGAFTATNQGIQHSLPISWTTVGTKTIMVTAINEGSDVTTSYQFYVEPGSDFGLSATPTDLTICPGDDAVYTINVLSFEGFSEPVTLSAMGIPIGTNAAFGKNPVNPPGSSSLTVGNTAAALPGSYSIDVVGTTATKTHTTTVNLDVLPAGPVQAPTPLSPPNGATNVPIRPIVFWSTVPFGTQYLLEIATDPAFNTIVYTQTTSGPGGTIQQDLEYGTEHFWRVTSSNPCSTGPTSVTFSFTTEMMPVPNVGAAPLSFTVSLEEGGTLQPVLTISNTGQANLTWALTEDWSGSCGGVNDIPWLLLSDSGGTLISGQDVDVTLSFIAAGLSPGSYTGALCLSTNDPDTPLITIPLTMVVEADGYFVYLPAVLK
jgi:YVTN family beta-propeller protein